MICDGKSVVENMGKLNIIAVNSARRGIIVNQFCFETANNFVVADGIFLIVPSLIQYTNCQAGNLQQACYSHKNIILIEINKTPVQAHSLTAVVSENMTTSHIIKAKQLPATLAGSALSQQRAETWIWVSRNVIDSRHRRRGLILLPPPAVIVSSEAVTGHVNGHS